MKNGIADLKNEVKHKLNVQAGKAIVMLFQQAVVMQQDISKDLLNLEFVVSEDDGTLIVTNPPTLKMEDLVNVLADEKNFQERNSDA